jgi:hypothetical protein
MRCPQKTAISGSVEILERNKQSLLGALFHIVLLAPAALIIPQYCDNHQKV